MSTPALLAAANSGLADLLMVAGRYTLAEQTGIPKLREACELNGVEIVTASVFNSGLLAARKPSPEARYDYGRVPAETLERVERIAQVCERFGVELPAAALQYTLLDPLVRAVVMGTSRSVQLRENVERSRMPIPEDLWNERRSEGLVTS